MSNIGLIHYTSLAIILFIIGILGTLLNRQNIIGILMSIELMLLGVNINMLGIGVYINNLSNQIFSIFILTVAAAEAAIGLAILVIFYRKKNSIAIDDVSELKG